MDERKGGGSGAEGGSLKSWREQLRDIKNAAVKRYSLGVPEEVGKSPEEIRAIRRAELEDKRHLLENLSAETHEDPAAHEATIFQKAALALVESAREHVIEPVKGTVIPVIPKVTYAVLTAALAEEGIPLKRAMALARVANVIVGRRLMGKAQDALGGIEQALDVIEDRVLRVQIKGEFERKIVAERAKEAEAARLAAAAAASGSGDEAVPAGAGGAGGGESGGGGTGGPEDPDGPDDPEDDDGGEEDEDERMRREARETLERARNGADSLQSSGGYEDEHQRFQSNVYNVKYSDSYRRKVEARVKESLTRYHNGKEPTDEEIQDEVDLEQIRDVETDFITNGLSQLDSDMSNAQTDEAKTQVIKNLAIRMQKVSRKYNSADFGRIYRQITDARFGSYARRGGTQDIKGIFRSLEDANIILPQDKRDFLSTLSSAKTVMNHLAKLQAEAMVKLKRNVFDLKEDDKDRLAIEREARKIAWEQYTAGVRDLSDRIMSNTVVRQDQVFNLDYRENSVLKGIQNKLRNIGNEMTTMLEQGHEVDVTVIDGTPDGRQVKIKFTKQSTIMVEDIDRNYQVRRDSRHLGNAVEEFLSGQVFGQKDRVEIIHNILHSINTGVGLETMKASAEKLPTEFVQRLLLKNSEYSDADQIYIRTLVEAIQRNGGYIPDDFGIKNAEGLDSVDEEALNMLLSMIPIKVAEGETENQHRNRVLQVLAAGKVTAFAFKGDALHIIKHAKPKPKFTIEPDGTVVRKPQGQQTHSRTYLKIAAELQPFFFHHLYGVPPNKPWITSVYIPRDVDAFVAHGGPHKEQYSHRQVLRWHQELIAAQAVGASEELRKDFYSTYKTLEEVEDQGYLGATQAGKFGNYDRHIVQRVDAEGRKVDVVMETVAQLRRVGSGYVHNYITKDAQIEWFADPANYSHLEDRSQGREHSLRELQDAYATAKRVHKSAMGRVERSGRMNKKAQKALVDLNETRKALVERITELEVITPLRDSMPSSMVSSERVPFTPDLEVDQGLTIRSQLNQSIRRNADVSAFIATYETDPESLQQAEAYVTDEISKIALSTQTMLESISVKRRRKEYDRLMTNGPDYDPDAAHKLMSASQNVFAVNAEFRLEDARIALADIYTRSSTVSRTDMDFNLAKVFPNEARFIAFMKQYSTDMQHAIGDMNAKVAQDLGVPPNVGTVRHEFYGSENNGTPEGKSVSKFLKEKRALVAQEKKAVGQARLDLQAEIDRINAHLDGWMTRHPIGGGIHRDSLMRRASSMIMERRGPILTELFNRDQAMEQANFTQLGQNFAQKQVNNGDTERKMVAASVPLWMDAMDKFVKTAGTGPKALKGAIGTLLGPLEAIAKEMAAKDLDTAAKRVMERILMIGRFVLEDPDVKMQIFGMSAQEIALRTKIPVCLMGTAFPDSARTPIFSADSRDIAQITQELVTKLSSVDVPAHRMRFLDTVEVRIDTDDQPAERLARGIFRAVDVPSAFVQDKAIKLERIARNIESRAPGGLLGRGMEKVANLLRGSAARLQTRAAGMQAPLSNFFRRFGFLTKDRKIIAKYKDQGATLELLRQAQASNSLDRARWSEDWPMWILTGGIAIGTILAWLLGPALENGKKK
ncbi:hypothetical protein KBC70_03675 [Candidatus Woesebacteria bacterium]|nr:hypothetical protein [Candidatus Woesebacteria bacterium]